MIPPPPKFTLGTMQSGKYSSPGNRQTQTLHEWSFCTGGKLSQSHAWVHYFTDVCRSVCMPRCL